MLLISSTKEKTQLNQQHWEYYSLLFSEAQIELSDMKVELGKIE
jgi:hypothetical protein